MTKPVLYSFRRCPYAMRARLALHVSGLDFEHREIILRAKPAHMLEISPKATVPVLLLPDGTVIDESLDIMHWALGQSDPDNWLGDEDAALIAANDGPFKHHLDRYKYDNRYEGADADEHRDAAFEILQGLDARLADSAFLNGNALSITDTAIAPFIRQFANTGRTWFDVQDLPHLQAWLAQFLESDLFARIMAKHDLWPVPKTV